MAIELSGLPVPVEVEERIQSVGRKRRDAVEILGRGTLPLERNLVVEKWSSLIVGRWSGGQGVIEHLQAILGIDQAAEVPPSHRLGRQVIHDGGSSRLA